MADRTEKPAKRVPTKPRTPKKVAAAVTPTLQADDVTIKTLPSGTSLHRVHPQQYAADEFNPSKTSNARFSSIFDANGDLISTMYAASTFEAAVMETSFHEISHAPGTKMYAKEKLANQTHSTLRLTEPLTLADFRSVPLRKLGLRRCQIIDTDANQYPVTRSVAEAIHAIRPDVQGLLWISRQDDSAECCVLFRDRIGEGVVRHEGLSRALDGDAYGEVLTLAEKIGVLIVPGKT